MNILIVEDDEQRIDWFKNQLAGHKLYIAKSTSSAINTLKQIDFDIVYLDHDLTEEAYWKDAHHSVTGYSVCLFLEQNPENNRDASFVVHSMNNSGSVRMMAALKNRNSTRLPYSELVRKAKA